MVVHFFKLFNIIPCLLDDWSSIKYIYIYIDIKVYLFIYLLLSIFLWLCLVLEKFERKCKGEKIERKSGRKEKIREKLK